MRKSIKKERVRDKENILVINLEIKLNRLKTVFFNIRNF